MRYLIAILLAVMLATTAYAGDSADKLYQDAEALLAKANFEKASTLYLKTIKLNPKHYDAYIGLGIAYAELGKHEKAIEVFTNAIKLKPMEPTGFINRGEVSLLMDKTEDACEDWLKACKLGQCKRLDIAILRSRCKPNIY